MPRSAVATDNRSFAELARAFFGEALSIDQAFAYINRDEFAPPTAPARTVDALWVGSVGYKKYKHNAEFAIILRDAGVQRLVDVRQLPISRRRGYAEQDAWDPRCAPD